MRKRERERGCPGEEGRNRIEQTTRSAAALREHSTVGCLVPGGNRERSAAHHLPCLMKKRKQHRDEMVHMTGALDLLPTHSKPEQRQCSNPSAALPAAGNACSLAEHIH